MCDYASDRAVAIAHYILTTKATIRQTASVFGVSKSTVHNDVSKRLKSLDFSLYKQVYIILRNHFEVKHLRGGDATRRKYLRKV